MGKHIDHGNEGSTRETRAGADHSHHPYWKRAHRDWRIWVALFFMLAAMTIYIMSEDLSLLPWRWPSQATPENSGAPNNKG